MVALIRSLVVRPNLYVSDHVIALIACVTGERSQGALTLVASSVRID